MTGQEIRTQGAPMCTLKQDPGGARRRGTPSNATRRTEAAGFFFFSSWPGKKQPTRPTVVALPPDREEGWTRRPNWSKWT